MELIDGITLKQYMERRGLLNWRESLHFITQIMRALSHAHSRGIVHRDIKPQNIMVLRDGSVRVTDFGIACLENSAQTLTQEALGSVHYISPEQARGDRTDARSDIYSSGVVLYEMLTGRLPFVGDSAVSVAIQHLSSIPLAPREINKEIPEQLELICMKAMTPDLERRYASAEAMISDLETFRKNPDVDLDFDLEDLRPEEVDEPTRPLRTAGIHAAAHFDIHRNVRLGFNLVLIATKANLLQHEYNKRGHVLVSALQHLQVTNSHRSICVLHSFLQLLTGIAVKPIP
jgi:serine/threonine-protein kinase